MPLRDDIDPCPVKPLEGSTTELQTIEAGPYERVELVLGPPEPMRDPVLRVSADPQQSLVDVDGLFYGRFSVEDVLLSMPALMQGVSLRLTASSDTPVKVVLTNRGPTKTLLAAYLVAATPRSSTQ